MFFFNIRLKRKSYELCGQMGHLIGPSGIGKAQLTHLIEAIMRPFREHDKMEFQKLVDWQREMKTKAANKEKPEKPDGTGSVLVNKGPLLIETGFSPNVFISSLPSFDTRLSTSSKNDL